MILPEAALAALIYGALGLTCLAPVLLMVLLWRDWRRNRLW